MCDSDQAAGTVFFEFLVIATEIPKGDFGHLITNPMTSSARIELEILDINDNAPYIETESNARFEIEENRGAGSLLNGPIILVNDVDSAYSNSKWFIRVVNNGSCPVEAMPEEGFRSQEIKLRTLKDFDYESFKSCDAQLVVYDQNWISSSGTQDMVFKRKG